MSFFLVHINKIIDNIRSNPNITAKTIIAGNANKITNAKAAPINSPITKVNANANIIVIIPKHLLLLHLFSFLS